MFTTEKAHGESFRESESTFGMKFSEAIRRGAKIRPQCAGRLFKDGHSCALGAAWEGKAGNTVPPNWNGRDWADYFRVPWEAIIDAITRNDSGKYTREQIADWLEAQGY